MSQTANQVSIQLLGKSLTIRCPEGQQEALHSAAREINTRCQTLRLSNKMSDTDQLLILIALNLAVELHALQEGLATESMQLQTKMQALQAAVQEALIKT